MFRAFVTIACFSSFCVVASAADSAKPDAALTFNRDIRPILVENCFACHGADSASRQADLRLDKRDAAVTAGAIAPGKSAESAMIARILTADPEELMPPPASHKKLTAAQKETLKRWVDSGAEYEPHWSYVAPVRPVIPTVKDQAWVRNPIDAFVLAKLEANNLRPAPEADRRTLAQRAALDVIGLPPDPADVEAFVADEAPDAYDRYLDKLFAKPQWGEHRARYWLDYARYADTHGIHFDNYREMWSYRDWVIDAFNADMPYDRFTLENLAGDLLPDATLSQKIGSGFNRCNITTNEGGIIDEEYLVLYTRDRLETTSAVWLGLTTQCAVCHDHKFDAISQREFYEMAAFFNNTTQAAKDGNVRNTPPIIDVPIAADSAIDRTARTDRRGQTKTNRSTREGRARLPHLGENGRSGRRNGRAARRSSPLLRSAFRGQRKRVRLLRRRDDQASQVRQKLQMEPGRSGSLLDGRNRRRRRPARGREFRDRASLFVRRMGLHTEARNGRRIVRANGRTGRTSRLGPVDGRRPRRHAYHFCVADGCVEGRRQSRTQTQNVDPRFRLVRRFAKILRRKNLLRQRLTTVRR
ncbi:MAG: DUF1549 domain-containing protein [Pirellulales bacterium]